MSERVYGYCDKSPDYLHELGVLCVNLRPVPAIEPAKPLHKVGVSVLLIEDGSILLGKRGPKSTNIEARGMLSTPGGRLELSESFLDCARREFKEETGADLEGNLNILDVRKYYRFGDHYIMVYVLATDHTGEIGNPEGEDKCEGGWQWFLPQYLLYSPNFPMTEPFDILHLALAKAFKASL